jgi:hypothetical protein
MTVIYFFLQAMFYSCVCIHLLEAEIITYKQTYFKQIHVINNEMFQIKLCVM